MSKNAVGISFQIRLLSNSSTLFPVGSRSLCHHHPVVIVHRHFEVEVLLHIGVHIHGQLTEKQVEVEVPYQLFTYLLYSET